MNEVTVKGHGRRRADDSQSTLQALRAALAARKARKAVRQG